MSGCIAVINAGSSSVKFALYRPQATWTYFSAVRSRVSVSAHTQRQGRQGRHSDRADLAS